MDSSGDLTTPRTFFREVQKMNQKWLWAIILILVIFTWYGAYQQLIQKVPFGTNPAPDWLMLVLFVGFGILFPLFFHSMKLITEVKEDGLYVRFYPFHLSFKKFPFENIRSFEVRNYSPLRDYGGWGIRYGPKGQAYNTSGNRGVLFEIAEGKKLDEGKKLNNGEKPEEGIKLNDGKKLSKLMIGSQIPEEFSAAVRQGMLLQRRT